MAAWRCTVYGVSMPRRYPSLAERFWLYAAIATTGCWLWTGRLVGKYGQLVVKCGADRAYHAAHRLSWEIHFGAIPVGLFVLHRCDNPPCVNPSHLFLGTHAENMADMRAKGRGARSEAQRKNKRPRKLSLWDLEKGSMTAKYSPWL